MTIDVDALIAANDVVAIVGHYTQLTKVGGEFKGRCLWHSPDANPSMFVVPKKRMAYCFACGEGGNVIDVVMQAEGLDFKGACARLNGSAPPEGWKPRVAPEPKRETPERVTSKPPTPATDKQFVHRDFGAPDHIIPFRDAAGDVLGYECRWERADGKESRMLTWGTRGDRPARWEWGHFNYPRPLFGLDRLAEMPQAQVLAFEGPIKARAAQEVFPHHACVAWSGGARSWHRHDWTPLAGRKVVVWPDNDAPGLEAGERLAAILADPKGLAATVKLVDPNRMPESFDIRDALAEGWDFARLIAWLRERAKPVTGSPSEPPPTGAVQRRSADAGSDPDANSESVNSSATTHVLAPTTTGTPPEPEPAVASTPPADAPPPSSADAQQPGGAPTNAVPVAQWSRAPQPNAEVAGSNPAGDGTISSVDAATEALASVQPTTAAQAAAPSARKRGKPSLAAVDGNTVRQPDPENDSKPFPLSPDALADAFAAQHENDWRYVNGWKTWLRWAEGGGPWRPDETYESFQKARELARSAVYWPEAAPLSPKEKRALTNRTYIGGFLHLAGGDRRLASRVGDWDTDPLMLGVPGGVVDLRLGKLIEGAREQHISKSCSVAPEQGPCPTWERIWQRIAQGDSSMYAYFKRMWGYILTGDTREECFFFFYGQGRSGKSKPVRAVQEIMGDYAQAANPETFMHREREQHTSEVAVMAGARLIVCSETEDGKRLNESRVKQLSGQDVIRARLMRQDGGDFVPHLKLLMYGNFQPALRGTGAEIRDRIHMVNFPGTIPEEERDKFLAEKLREEYPQILHWMIQGCLDWQSGGLGKPEAIELASQEYVDSQDTIGEWIADACTQDGRQKTGELFDAWKRWAGAREEYVGSPKRFTQKLKDRGYRMVKSSVSYVEGLRLRESGPQRADPYG